MDTKLIPAHEYSLIQWQCQQFLYRATQLMDKGDWQALADCYTEDAVLYRPSDSDNGIKGKQAILESFLARPARTSSHLLANTVFDIESPSKVIAHSQVWLMTGEQATEKPVKADPKILAGNFIDTLVLHNENWYFASRKGGMDLVMNTA